MKRSELKIGESYYYDRSTNWAAGGYGTAHRVVVVDDKRYRIATSTWGFRAPRYTEDPKGTAVLVDIYRDGLARPARDCVPVAHLRGPWEETQAAVQARQDAERAAASAAAKGLEQVCQAGQAAVERGKSFGVVAVLAKRYSDPHIQLSVDEFVALLDRLGGGSGAQ